MSYLRCSNTEAAAANVFEAQWIGRVARNVILFP